MQINLVVFIYTFVSLSASVSSNKYCEICANHTMCRFDQESPSTYCVSHDEKYILSDIDIKNLVDKINEKRNFIASGSANKDVLPQAANMRKVRWSVELATFAQRWANQCHPAVSPNEKDQCRDLPKYRVNQLVTSILGWSPGLYISSFVNVWFMSSMDYNGSVSYYNRSINAKTDDFTQLIWADTYLVGCGFVDFILPKSKISVKRLVCNFAPQGNVHGKPVYTIGYPATQCMKDQIADTVYNALCSDIQQVNNENKSLADGILRILNLSNITDDMDPIDVNIRQELNDSKQERNQIIRHIHNNTNYNYFENNFRGMPHMTLSNPNPWFQVTTSTGKYMVYHGGQEHAHTARYNKYRKNYVLSTERPTYFPQEEDDCTRRNSDLKTRNSDFRNIDDCKIECSKKLEKCNGKRCEPQTMFSLHTFQPETKNTRCGCEVHTTSSYAHRTSRTIPTSCGCRVTCEITTTHQCPSFVGCPTLYHTINVTPPNFHYYNLALRSADSTLKTDFKNHNAPKKRFGEDLIPDYSENEDYVTDSSIKIINKTHLLDDSKDTDYVEFQPDNDKIKRTAEKIHSAVPLWKNERNIDKSIRQVKALRYTTLPGSYHISKKIMRVTSRDLPTIQYQPITNTYKLSPTKERYLSFEELMELRKNQADFFLNDEWGSARKNADYRKKATTIATTKATTTKKAATKATTTKPTTTHKTPEPKSLTQQELKIESPDHPVIARIDHCTRIMTCTWTALTNSEGNIITPGGGGGGQSRTPPGYVEGCTRTSTCTRIHVDRNILKTTTEFEDPNVAREEDQDYCDRRKRDDDTTPAPDQNDNTEGFTHHYESYIDTYTDVIATTPSSKLNNESFNNMQSKHSRRKRQYQQSRPVHLTKKITDKGFKLSYENLHNLVLHRTLGILDRNIEEHYKNCSCNSSYTIRSEVETILIICYVYLYFEYLY